ncbi:MAG TPA: hypothetical protein VKT73_12790 [Xanthobacteraceae bacterium]|nr:hypothetical protein [Xanthobacteraceae bacterium]
MNRPEKFVGGFRDGETEIIRETRNTVIVHKPIHALAVSTMPGAREPEETIPVARQIYERRKLFFGAGNLALCQSFFAPYPMTDHDAVALLIERYAPPSNAAAKLLRKEIAESILSSAQEYARGGEGVGYAIAGALRTEAIRLLEKNRSQP